VNRHACSCLRLTTCNRESRRRPTRRLSSCSTEPPCLCRCKVSWDGTPWTLVNVGETTVSLLNADATLIDVPSSGFDALIAAGRSRPLSPAESRWWLLRCWKCCRKPTTDLRVANLRCRVVFGRLRTACGRQTLPFRLALCGGGPPGTVQRKESTGMDIWGYCREHVIVETRPNACRKHAPFDERVHCRRLRNSEAEVHVHLMGWAERTCEAQNLLAPSYKTFTLAVRGKGGFRQTLKRQGRRAAYVQELSISNST